MDSEIVEILLVEDNPNDIELTLRALKKNKIANNIVVVNDGAKALDFLFSTGEYGEFNHPEHLKVVLLDLKLPKVDGLEILKLIKNNDKLKHIPVVVLTSSKEERDIVESYMLGANSYIVKPVDFEKFIEAVNQLGFYWLLLNQPNLK